MVYTYSDFKIEITRVEDPDGDLVTINVKPDYTMNRPPIIKVIVTLADGTTTTLPPKIPPKIS